METNDISPHKATHEYGFNCDECGEVFLFAFVGSIDSDTMFTDCPECGVEEARMRKTSLSEVPNVKKFNLHLRQFVSEEAEELNEVGGEEVVSKLRSLADDIEAGDF